jgi:putative transferase (TIGR04331 family)
MRHLHLTTVTGAFDPIRDIAVGPYCFLGHEETYPGWREYQYSEPFLDDDDMERSYEAVIALCNNRMRSLAAELNARHGIAKSVDFWRLIAMPWLMELVQRLWVQYARLEEIKTRTGGDQTRLDVWLDPVDWKFGDIEQFQDGLLHDSDFNWWVDSHIAAAVAPATWALHPVHRDLVRMFRPSPMKPHERPGWRGALRRVKMRWGLTDIYGARWATIFLGALISILPRTKSEHRIHPVDDGFRPDSFFPAPFLALLEKMIAATMPESYGARFGEYAAFAASLPVRPGRLRLGVIDLWNEMEKIAAAYAHESGERIVIPQHGGFYALLRWHIHAQELECRNGAMFTWGWDRYRTESTRLIPLPAPLPSRHADSHRFRDRRLILVGSVIRFRMMRISVRPNGGAWLDYCRHAAKFLETLTPAVRAHTWFRPYMNTSTDITHDYVTGPFPTLRLLTGNLHEAMIRCRLLVTTGPDTTMHLALAANVPTVAYWDPDFHKLSGDAMPYFDRLKRAGIYFDSAEDAARHINAIWDNVEAWWSDPETQAARKFWIDHFARSSKFWLAHWVFALIRLSKEKWR